ncbi:MAG: cupin domain-containing protein [Planctomycetaceae bacterium]
MTVTQPSERLEIIVFENEITPTHLADRIDHRSLISGNVGSKGLSTGIATFQVGAMLPLHTHPTSEVIIPLSGKIRAIVEGRRYLLEQYDALHIPRGIPHCVHNDLSDEPVTCFTVFATEQPTREWVQSGFTIEDHDATSSSVPEHLTRMSTAPVYELAEAALFRDLFTDQMGSRGICGGYGKFQPGSSLPCHIHGYDESITIVEGEAVCQVAGQEYTLSNNATACVPEGRPHRFINRSNQPMAMIWVYAGDEPDRTILDQCCCEQAESAKPV